jgi:hypothetical protein
MDQHEPYYTQAMSRDIAAIDSTRGVSISIYQHEDDEGPYLIAAFSYEEYAEKLDKFGGAVAQYIIDVMNALREHGVRVTMLVAE